MIKFIVARHEKDDSDIIKNYLNKNTDLTKDAIMEIWEGHSMFEKYNSGIQAWIEDYKMPLQDNDILCFMHEDIEIIDKDFTEKVEYIFNNRPKVGVLGVIGTKSFAETGGWWLTSSDKLSGHIIQGRPDLSESFHMIKKIEYTEDAVSVDGCIFLVRASLAKQLLFDDSTFGGYHFYDCDYCYSTLEKGFHIAIADILVSHASEGPMDNTWIENRNKFISKWKSKGLIFPVTKASFII